MPLINIIIIYGGYTGGCRHGGVKGVGSFAGGDVLSFFGFSDVTGRAVLLRGPADGGYVLPASNSTEGQ